MTFRSETTATIKWVSLPPTNSARVFIVARVPRTVFVGTVFDETKGQYTKFEQRQAMRDQECHVWTDSTKGQLIASLCLQVERTQKPIKLSYYDTGKYGWKLTGASLVE